MKNLNLAPADRLNCLVTYNVNRFEIYHADGWLMTTAISKDDIEQQLAQNEIKNAMFDRAATYKYLQQSKRPVFVAA
tara:strand:+ start:424 stop:654 length:231 start_codon:yes stop_codon:yes gene_type:complete